MYPQRDALTGQYGYWSGTEWSIAPQFSAAYPFSEGQALIKSDSKLSYGFLNLIGKATWLNELTGVELEGNGFYDYLGRPCRTAICREPSGVVWLLDRELNARKLARQEICAADDVACVGDILIARWQSSLEVDQYGLFDFNGKWLVHERSFDGVRPSSDNGQWVVRNKGRWTFLSVRTGDIYERTYEDATPFSSGLGSVSIDGTWEVVDDRMEKRFDSSFDRVEMFLNGYAVAYLDGQSGYLDTSGCFRHFVEYVELGSMSRFGIGIGNRDSSEWSLDLIRSNGERIVGGYSAADFTDGDYPQFELWKDDVVELYSPISGQIALPPYLI